MKNICAIIASLFLFFSICPVSHSYEKQDIFSLIPQEKDRLLKYKLDSNFDEVYNRINDIYTSQVDKTSQQSISGGKIFTGSVTVSSFTSTGSISTGSKHWEVIFSTTISVAVSSYTISGINGNSDIQYKIDSHLKGSGVGDIAIYFNGDKGATSYTYLNYYMSSSAMGYTGGASAQIPYGGVGTTSQGGSTAHIFARINSTTQYPSVVFSGGYDTFFYSGCGTWKNPGANLTSITIFQIAGGTLTGDITLWALR